MTSSSFSVSSTTIAHASVSSFLILLCLQCRVYPQRVVALDGPVDYCCIVVVASGGGVVFVGISVSVCGYQQAAAK